MKTFTRHRTLKELRTEIKRRGWKLDTEKFNEGSDYIDIIFKVGRVSGKMLVSMINGRFFGSTDRGTTFSSDSVEHDREPWFKALLEAVYIP